MTFLDTHVLVWLYQKELHRFTDTGMELLEREELRVSPMIQLELSFLHEIGRLRVPGREIFAYLHSTLGLLEDRTAFSAVVGTAQELTWTRDPFDRIIVAQAELTESALLTKDETIRNGSRRAVW